MFEPSPKEGFAGPKSPDPDESLIAAFERVAAAVPSRLALGSDAWEPTYRELNETANRLAHRLIARGVAVNDRVAILMPHDAPLIAAALGILKAGSTVVALDPTDPVARLMMLVQDAEPGLIVTDAQNRDLAAECGFPGRSVLNFESETAAGSVQNLAIEIPSRQTAFLTYTSGTTGRPKGVMQTHRQFRRSAAAVGDAMQLTENDRIPLFSMVSTGFGAGSGLWGTLLHGATLCPFSPKTRSIVALADWILGRGLTVYVSSASLFRTLLKTIDDRRVFADVRAVMLHGETVTADDFQAFRRHFPPTSVLIHTLASSETANIAWSRWTHGDKVPAGAFGRAFCKRHGRLAFGHDGSRSRPAKSVNRRPEPLSVEWLLADPELTAERFSADLDGNGTRRCGPATEGGSTPTVCSNTVVARTTASRSVVTGSSCLRSSRCSETLGSIASPLSRWRASITNRCWSRSL